MEYDTYFQNVITVGMKKLNKKIYRCPRIFVDKDEKCSYVHLSDKHVASKNLSCCQFYEIDIILCLTIEMDKKGHKKKLLLIL